MCQMHFEGLVVPDPWIVITSPSAVATRAAAMDARKIVVAWVAFITYSPEECLCSIL